MVENGSRITVFKLAYPEPKSSRQRWIPASVNSSTTFLKPSLYSVAKVMHKLHTVQVQGT